MAHKTSYSRLSAINKLSCLLLVFEPIVELSSSRRSGPHEVGIKCQTTSNTDLYLQIDGFIFFINEEKQLIEMRLAEVWTERWLLPCAAVHNNKDSMYRAIHKNVLWFICVVRRCHVGFRSAIPQKSFGPSKWISSNQASTTQYDFSCSSYRCCYPDVPLLIAHSVRLQLVACLFVVGTWAEFMRSTNTRRTGRCIGKRPDLPLAFQSTSALWGQSDKHTSPTIILYGTSGGLISGRSSTTAAIRRRRMQSLLNRTLHM